MMMRCFIFQIPFFPLIKKDLTFIHFGNDSRVDGLVNFEKLRMVSKEVHFVTSLATGTYLVSDIYDQILTPLKYF